MYIYRYRYIERKQTCFRERNIETFTSLLLPLQSISVLWSFFLSLYTLKEIRTCLAKSPSSNCIVPLHSRVGSKGDINLGCDWGNLLEGLGCEVELCKAVKLKIFVLRMCSGSQFS